MRLRKSTIVFISIVVTFMMTLFTSGCATKPISVYQSWGNQLAGAA